MKKITTPNPYQTSSYTVTAPNKAKDQPKSTVIKGNDLRVGGGKSK